MLILIQACTGQQPAGIKNSTRSNEPIKAPCNQITVDGNSLSHKNILNIFECSGWSEKYPNLTNALRTINPGSMDNVLSVINEPLFSNAKNQKKFFDRISIAQDNGQMTALSTILEKSLRKSDLLTQFKKFLTNKNLNSAEKSIVMKMVSDRNEVNVRNLRSLRAITQAFENNKSSIKSILNEDEDKKFNKRIITLVDEMTKKIDANRWEYVSKIIYNKKSSPIKQWMIEGLTADPTV